MRFNNNILLAATYAVTVLTPGAMAGGSLALRGLGETLGMAAVDIIVGEPVFNDRRRGNHYRDYSNGNNGTKDVAVGVLATQYLSAIDSCNIGLAGTTAKIDLVDGQKGKIKLSGLTSACIYAHATWNRLPGLAELNALFGAVEVMGDDSIEVTLAPAMVSWLDKYTSFYRM
ncbi:hypothetical protein B0T14DRAFT_555965 [Immersiella caudata]|uniref:Uncharacterized protein n=1 Tax=Immersiella caudata TaxID=314043 RepID=A0AA39WJF7_9PEZI|nr:hypothetical protein B0T14DRAFT_555965 [Immersiella caudata]